MIISVAKKILITCVITACSRNSLNNTLTPQSKRKNRTLQLPLVEFLSLLFQSIDEAKFSKWIKTN